MSITAPYQVVYKNQLQFNLGVPLTAQNLAVRFSRPSPIFVERIGGQHGLPATVVAKQTSGPEKSSGDSVFNYSTLSQDRMEMMSQLAKRDLRNRRLQAQMSKDNPSSESPSPASSPSRTRLHQKNSHERFSRQEVMKPRRPLTAKETDKNRRLGAVQTPPPRKPVTHLRRDDYFPSARNASVNVTTDSDVFFPMKPLSSEGGQEPKDEVERLQQEAEGYLSLIERIHERAVSEPSVRFLHPSLTGNRKDEFLLVEENSDRVRIRVEEQNTRLTRNLYNLKLKVKQLQRDVAHPDSCKLVRKNQILSQLGTIYRGAVKALQTFTNQLPYQELKEGLPSHCLEISALLRQLTTLNAAMKQGKESDGDRKLLEVLDRIDNLNMKWNIEPKKVCFQTDKKDQKSAVIKDWVSDTKVDKNIFVRKNQPELKFPLEYIKLVGQPLRQAVPRGRPKKRSFGKENILFGAVSAAGKSPLELRSAVASLLQSKSKVTGADSREHFTNGGVTSTQAGNSRKPPRQAHLKGFLLPHDLMVKREKAQRAVALSNQDRRYADSTLATSLKKSPSRPYSAPANARHKEVNFELDRQLSTPWIPPGRSARSRSLSSEPKSRSRSPFYLREMDIEEARHMFPEKRSPMVKMSDENIFSKGFHSLPTEKKLRSTDVSNSFIDEVEHRLLRRLMGRVAENDKAPRNSAGHRMSQRKEAASADTTADVGSDVDEPLDATDLSEEVRLEAVSAVDAPTIENMKQRLVEMQREQRDIRQRWSTLKFTDTKPNSRIFTSSDIQSDRFMDPPAIEVTRMSKTERPINPKRFITDEWSEEPVIFTKSTAGAKVRFVHTVDPRMQDDLRPEPSLVQLKKPKRLVTVKQTAVERIVEDREKFESYLKRRSHHPAGKFDPWKLVEEISDEILSDCLVDVAAEVEVINEEIANHMYRSEFMVDTGDPETRLPREQAEMLMKPAGARDGYAQDRHSTLKLEVVKNGGVESGFVGEEQSVLGHENRHKIIDKGVYAGGNLRNTIKIPEKSPPPRRLLKSPETMSPPQSFARSSMLPQRSLSKSPEKMLSQRSLSESSEKILPRRSLSKSPDKISQRSLSESPEKMFSQRSLSESPEKMFSQRSLSVTPEKIPPKRSLSVSPELSPQINIGKNPEKTLPVASAAEPQLENVFDLLHHSKDVFKSREEMGGGDVQREEVGGGNVKTDGSKKNDEDYEDDYEESSKAVSYKSSSDNKNDEDDDDDEYGLDDFEDVSDEELKDVKYDESEDVSEDD